MKEAREVLRRHIMAALPQPTAPASGDAMSIEQHTADLALKQAWDAMDRLAAMGWPLVLWPAYDDHAELDGQIDKAVADRSSQEFPKWVKSGGKKDGADMLCANAEQEANVRAGRMPDEAAPAKVKAAKAE